MHFSIFSLKIFVLLLFARWLVMRQWLRLARRTSSPGTSTTTTTTTTAGCLASLDLTAIAVTTGLGDLLGTAILTAFLHAAEGA